VTAYGENLMTADTTDIPVALSSACTRAAPYVQWLFACTLRMRSLSAASTRARWLGLVPLPGVEAAG
jgi:hypothetical protein